MGEVHKESIRLLQTAYLEAWIGDLRESDRIYRTVADNTLLGSALLMDLQIDFPRRSWALAEPVNADDEEKPPVIIFPTDGGLRKWKYTVCPVSKYDQLMRFNVRGYLVQDDLLYDRLVLPKAMGPWSIQSDYDGVDPWDLLWLHAKLAEKTSVQIYLTLDRWGLLNGDLITNENDSEYAFQHVQVLLRHLEDALWPRTTD